MDFYESEEYRPYRTSRIAGARNEFLLVAGEDIAGYDPAEDQDLYAYYLADEGNHP